MAKRLKLSIWITISQKPLDIDISNQWKQSSFLTASLPDNFHQTVRQEASNNNAVLSWNQLVTTIGLHNEISPPYFARDYALMHVAIYDALLHSINNNDENKGKSSEVAILAGAAAEALAYLFPENFTSIATLEEQ